MKNNKKDFASVKKEVKTVWITHKIMTMIKLRVSNTEKTEERIGQIEVLKKTKQ